MKRVIAAAMAGAVLALSAGMAVAGEWKKVRIATEGAYAPWNFTDSSGQLVGFELDLAADLCKRMKVECEIVPQAWEGIIPALTAGKYDAIMAGMSITEERKKTISFSGAYAATPAVFVVLEDSAYKDFKASMDFITLDDVSAEEQKVIDEIISQFKGKSIGVQVATTHANFLEKYLSGDVDIRPYDTQENLDLDLQAGRVDAALASMSYWVPLLESEKGKGMKMVGPGLTGGVFGEGVGVGIRQDDKDLVAMFSEAIAAANADGTVKKLAIQWFGFDASVKPGS